jgi:excisionase family DNA binding protein
VSIQHISAPADDEPFVVSPRRACHLLDCGITRIYELINSRKLETYKDGASRKIVTASIREYVKRQLEGARAA